jgi:hypothetical protein
MIQHSCDAALQKKTQTESNPQNNRCAGHASSAFHIHTVLTAADSAVGYTVRVGCHESLRDILQGHMPDKQQ